MEAETRSPHSSQRRSEFFRQVDEDRKILRDIHTALVGDGLGNPGLVKRIEAVEKKVETHDRKLWLAGLSVTGAFSVALVFVKKVWG